MVEGIKIELTQQQSQLCAKLRDLFPPLEECFVGAICVKSDVNNPARFVLASHACREILEKLPEVTSKSSIKRPADTNALLQPILAKWDDVVEKGDWPLDDQRGKISRRLYRFLSHFSIFSDTCKTLRPKRRAIGIGLFQSVNSLPTQIPEAIVNHRWSELDEYRTEFNKISHLRKPSDQAHFEQWFNAFESFLVHLLIPRKFDTEDEIAELIKKGEGK